MELNLGENYTPDLQYEINKEVAEHTEACAFNIATSAKHDTCRDCPCHRYKKF